MSQSKTFFLTIKGDEEKAKQELVRRELPMVGEPCGHRGVTTVRVEGDVGTLGRWRRESFGAPATGYPDGTLLHFDVE